MDDHAHVTPLDAFLFLVFLGIFLGGYYRAVLSPVTGRPDGFGDSTFISNLHSVTLCLLACLSLGRVVPESVPVSWSVSFFAVDLADCVVRGEAMWSVHAVISLALNLLTWRSAPHRALRSVSKGFFAEASTVSRPEPNNGGACGLRGRRKENCATPSVVWCFFRCWLWLLLLLVGGELGIL
jgi:hypothetical protein